MIIPGAVWREVVETGHGRAGAKIQLLSSLISPWQEPQACWKAWPPSKSWVTFRLTEQAYSHSTEMSLVSFLNSGSPVTTAAVWIKAVAAAKQSA